jgi:pyruvate/2-oxoglutarate dehydrogenase complex dihydrolipoamide acyltransferase (E2) component
VLVRLEHEIYVQNLQHPNHYGQCVRVCVCVYCTDDPSWEHKALVPGQEPADALQALQEQAAKKAAADKQAAAAAQQEAAAAREAEAQKAAAAAAAAAAAEPTRVVQTSVPVQQPGVLSATIGMQDSPTTQAEAAQQRQRTAFIGQAASWGTVICILGLMGLVVLWHMRSSSTGNGQGVGRRWGRYAAVSRRPPSPPPGHRTSSAAPAERLV